MKKILAVAVMVLVAAGTFAQSAKAPVTLSIIANQDWVTKPYMKAAWANYEKVTGNRLDIQALPIDNWETIMKTRAAAGELPDIVMTFAGPALDAMKPAETFFDLSNEAFVKDLKPFGNYSGQRSLRNRIGGLDSALIACYHPRYGRHDHCPGARTQPDRCPGYS